MTLDKAGYRIPHNNRDTSKAAAEKAAKFSATLRHRAFLVIRERGLEGATCEEVEEALRTHSHQSISARLWELAQEMSIFDSMHRRKNRSDSEAIVWMHAEVAPSMAVAPYLEYQRAQNTLEVIRKTLSNLDRAVPLLGLAELEHLDALKAFLTEQRHTLERVPEPPPFPRSPEFIARTISHQIVEAALQPPVTSASSSGSTLHYNGKEILL